MASQSQTPASCDGDVAGEFVHLQGEAGKTQEANVR